MRRSKSTSALKSLKKIASRAGLVVRKSRKGKGLVGGRVRRRKLRRYRRRRGRGLVGGCEMGGALDVDPSVMAYYQNMTGGRRRRKKGTKKGTYNSGFSKYILTRDDLLKGPPPKCLEWGPWDFKTKKRDCLKFEPFKYKLKPYEDKLRKAFETYAISKADEVERENKDARKRNQISAAAASFKGLQIPEYIPKSSYDALFDSGSYNPNVVDNLPGPLAF
jgi:hypothetical protein